MLNACERNSHSVGAMICFGWWKLCRAVFILTDKHTDRDICRVAVRLLFLVGALVENGLLQSQHQPRHKCATQGRISCYRQGYNVVLSADKLRKYFPRSYTPQRMEETILKLLDAWLRKRQREQSR